MARRKKSSIELYSSPLSVRNSTPILALKNNVLFPGVVTGISVGRTQSINLIDGIDEGDVIGVVTQKDPDDDIVKPGVLYDVGTAAEVLRISEGEGGEANVLVRGIERIKVIKYIRYRPYVVAQVKRVAYEGKRSLSIEAMGREIRKTVTEMVRLSPEIPPEVENMVRNIREEEVLADIVAANLDISVSEKQEILETVPLYLRLQKVYRSALKQLQVLKITNEIQSEAQSEIDKGQREYILRNQLKAIRDKLGESGAGDPESDVENLQKRLKEKKNIPPEVEKTLTEEIGRLSRMRDISPEYTMARTYIDWLLDLPWLDFTEDSLDLKKVKKTLDRDHYNLEKVKERVLEYLAVRKLKNDMKGPILCLVGAPGVGKTSLGRSVAEAMGRKFVRISLGGVHDEAEVRGHRRTYIGAMPGKIIQGIKKAGSANPVFMLDEIDKLGRDYRGDPSSALLEVLDPEQNFSFQDHYINLPFDLSRVLFIATANLLETVPPALRDRMEVIELPGYIQEEKVQICKRHLLPKQIKEHGLPRESVTISEDVLGEIIQSYTREAGVRNVERELAAICRKVAVRVADGGAKNPRFDISSKKLVEFLGPPKYLDELKVRVTRPGIATGLAWTYTGGEIIFIEATDMPGRSEIALTGQLGDVMKESAHAAMAFVRANAVRLGLNPHFFDNRNVHIHIPEGAIPKDGPSAGITLLLALVSLFTNIKVRDDTAMTGEISLRGLVLPVGGIKNKILAARRSGIKRVIIPERNKKDLVEIPEDVINSMDIIAVDLVDEALENALEKKISPLPRLIVEEVGAVSKKPPASS
ncbi:MAG: endopeptidase La [Myxococcota bacterium]